MALLIKIGKNYTTEDEINYVIKHIKDKAIIDGGQNLQVDYVAQQMKIIRDYYYQNSGNLLYYLVFAPDPNRDFISLDDLYELSYKICRAFPNLQVFFGIHCDNNGYCTHLALNPVSLLDGSKFCFTNDNIYMITKSIKQFLPSYSIDNFRFINKPVNHEFKFSECKYI